VRPRCGVVYAFWTVKAEGSRDNFSLAYETATAEALATRFSSALLLLQNKFGASFTSSTT
jgi:hypothetical protein